jgi:hypothetical protein
MNKVDGVDKDDRKYRVRVLQNGREVVYFDVPGADRAQGEVNFWARSVSALPLTGEPLHCVNVEHGLAVRADALDAAQEQTDLVALLAQYREVVQAIREKAVQVRADTEAIGCGLMHALPVPGRIKPNMQAGLWAVRWNDLEHLRYGCLYDKPHHIVEVSKTGKRVTLADFAVVKASEIAGTFLTKEEAEQAIEHSKVTNVMVYVLEHARKADLVNLLNKSQAVISCSQVIKAAA